MILFAQLLNSALLLTAMAVLWPAKSRNPVFLFVGFNWFFSSGTLANLDTNLISDRAHIYIIIFAAVGVLFYSLIFFNWKQYRATERVFANRMAVGAPTFSNRTAWFLFVFSALVSFVYFRFLVGYNLLLPALAGADLDFTSLRLAAYAGDMYTGAGIVNQFKNTVLPITFFCIIAAYASAKRWLALGGFLLIATPIFLWCILGTGQRTFLFFSMLGVIYYFFVRNKRISPLLLTLMAVFFVFFFGVLSAALGRTSDTGALTTFGEISRRLLNANQIGAVFGFRYVYTKEITYGAEWLQALIGLLPGARGSTLSSDVFNSVFGGFRGTIPVSLWTSVYHNFGMLGVAPAAILIMKVIESTHIVLRFIPVTHLHLLAYSYMCFYFAIMPATPPLQILNNGLLGVILVFLLGGLHIRKSKISARFA
jgi:oligosaccharide repeat unit polymerase